MDNVDKLENSYKIVEIEKNYRVLNVRTDIIGVNVFTNTYDAISEAIKLWSQELVSSRMDEELKAKKIIIEWKELTDELKSALSKFFR